MRAHIIENGMVKNTIELASLEDFPGAIEATEGGIGWGYVDGVFTAPPPPPPADPADEIKKQILALEVTITARRRDEAILGIDDGWLANVRAQIAALRSQL